MTIYDHLEASLPAARRLRIIEIGAANGEDTRKLFKLARSKCEDLEFWCFEPDPRNFSELQNSTAHLSIRALNLAVGKTDCETELFLSSGASPWHGREHTLSSSIKRPQEHLLHFPWCTFPRTLRVRQVSLDSFFCALPGHVDFIWCDAQGAEGDIIEGGKTLLQRTRLFYFESSRTDSLYEGQLTRRELLAKLPKWSVVEEYSDDILVENQSFEAFVEVAPLLRS